MSPHPYVYFATMDAGGNIVAHLKYAIKNAPKNGKLLDKFL